MRRLDGQWIAKPTVTYGIASMNHEQEITCEDSESLLVKKISGELLPRERELLESHLSQCALCVAKEQELVNLWQRVGCLAAPKVPRRLYEKTRELILRKLKRGKTPLPRTRRIPRGRA